MYFPPPPPLNKPLYRPYPTQLCSSLTYSNTAMLNSLLISPRNSPIFSLLRPFWWTKKSATFLGSSSRRYFLIRYWMPLVGFLWISWYHVIVTWCIIILTCDVKDSHGDAYTHTICHTQTHIHAYDIILYVSKQSDDKTKIKMTLQSILCTTCFTFQSVFNDVYQLQVEFMGKI